MECAKCGRQNQPTTRFCAECGDVVRADAPGKRRSRSKKRARRLRARIHWVRVPSRAAPSILAGTLRPSAVAIDAGRAPDRMMRRIDLVFAALVGVAGFAAYVGYPHLKGSDTATTATATAAPAARAPADLSQIAIPPPELTVKRVLESEPEQAPAPVAVSSSLPASPSLDVVPPRTPTPRAKPEALARRPAERAPPAPPRPSYAVTTAFGIEGFGPPPAAAPARVAAAPQHAPARKDPLQQMNDTLAGCAGAGLFARVACEQRALLAYCDGQWGQNERCPSGRRTDYGN